MRIERQSLKQLVWVIALVGAVGCAADGIEQEGPRVDVQSEELTQRLCRSDADCPAPGAPCQLCTDGSSACPEVSCERHRCVYSFPQCPPAGERVFCGGIAGIQCPGEGRCVDDPGDSCDPNHGGADCGGICSCIENVLCTVNSHFDSSPSVCTCVPNTPPPGSCGGHTCGAGQYCCNASCGICAPFGAACIQIACLSPL